MKNKKILMYVGIILIVLILLGAGYFVTNKLKNISGVYEVKRYNN